MKVAAKSLAGSLPTEILANIFSEPTLVQLQGGSRMSLETSQPPWILTYVCRRWKTIALGLHEIWSHIDLLGYGCIHDPNDPDCEDDQDPYPTHNYPFLLSIFLSRSADKPLTIRLGCAEWSVFEHSEPTERYFNNDLQREFLRYLLGHYMRWQDVTIVGFPGCADILQGWRKMAGEQLGFSSLRKLDFYPQNQFLSNRQILTELNHALETMLAFGRPQQLTLRHMDATVPAVGTLAHILSTTSITSLQLHHLNNYRQIIPILRALPELQDLKVSFEGCWHRSNPMQEEQAVSLAVVQLHSLTSLSLSFPRDAYSPWLRQIRIPNLLHLALEVGTYSHDGNWDELNSDLSLVIEQSGCRLTNLQLQGSAYTLFDATPCFSTLPYLQTFDCGFVVRPKLEQLAALLTSHSSGADAASLPFPLLSQLTFDRDYYDYSLATKKAREDSKCETISLVLKIAEYRTGISTGKKQKRGSSVLKEIRVGCIHPDSLRSLDFAERVRRLKERGCTIRLVSGFITGNVTDWACPDEQ